MRTGTARLDHHPGNALPGEPDQLRGSEGVGDDNSACVGHHLSLTERRAEAVHQPAANVENVGGLVLQQRNRLRQELVVQIADDPRDRRLGREWRRPQRLLHGGNKLRVTEQRDVRVEDRRLARVDSLGQMPLHSVQFDGRPGHRGPQPFDLDLGRAGGLDRHRGGQQGPRVDDAGLSKGGARA